VTRRFVVKKPANHLFVQPAGDHRVISQPYQGIAQMSVAMLATMTIANPASLVQKSATSAGKAFDSIRFLSLARLALQPAVSVVMKTLRSAIPAPWASLLMIVRVLALHVSKVTAKLVIRISPDAKHVVLVTDWIRSPVVAKLVKHPIASLAVRPLRNAIRVARASCSMPWRARAPGVHHRVARVAVVPLTSAIHA